MRTIQSSKIADAVARLCVQANRRLPCDVRQALERAHSSEPWPVAQDTLGKIIDNYRLAEATPMPICQDTGMACVFLDVGDEVYIEGNIHEAVDDGVRRGYSEGFLRKSVVRDPIRRGNTGDNTPAMLYLDQVAGDSITVTVAPKGFGSENMSRIAMLNPSAGRDGVVEFIVGAVDAAGSNPCPPIVVGVGIGGTFDRAALLAKKALLRPLGSVNSDPFYGELETELLDRINRLGIGPQGFGGKTTALGVAVETSPTHIAGLPVAVNINCHVARHATEVL
jgi:fumarate hydratase subunit alpha